MIPSGSKISVEAVSKIEKVVAFPLTRYSAAPATYEHLCQEVRQTSHGGIKICLDDVAYGMIPIRRNPQIYSRMSLDDAVQLVIDCIYATDVDAIDEDDDM